MSIIVVYMKLLKSNLYMYDNLMLRSYQYYQSVNQYLKPFLFHFNSFRQLRTKKDASSVHSGFFGSWGPVAASRKEN